MRLQIKKIIAREFLVLIVCIILGLLSFLLTYTYNLYRENQASNYEKQCVEKIKLSDSLSKCLSTIQIKMLAGTKSYLLDNRIIDVDTADVICFLNKYPKAVEVKSYTVDKDTFDISVSEINDFLKDFPQAQPLFSDIRFKKSFQYQDYIIKQKKSNELKAVIKDLKFEMNKIDKKLLSFPEQINWGFRILIISGIILFVLRYILYAIQWSLNILKQK